MSHHYLIETKASSTVAPLVLLPITGLTVEETFDLGETRFFTHSDGLARLTELGSDNPINSTATTIIGKFKEPGVTIIEVARKTFGEAIICARHSVDALRVFYTGEISDRHYPLFGLNGEIVSAVIEYLSPIGTEKLGYGAKAVGHIQGAKVSTGMLDRWRAGSEFGFVHESLKNPDNTEAARRAVLGTFLLSASILERNDDVALVLAMSALEAFVMPNDRSGKTLKLARYIAWFGCHAYEQNLCGRDRDACPYLLLNPDNENKKLWALRNVAESKVGWLCAEWLRVVKWYESRSNAVHGRSLGQSIDDARTVQHWITTHHYLPIMKWLADHPDDPTGDLGLALNSLERPKNFPEILTMIHQRNFDSPPPHDTQRWAERNDV